MSHGIFAYKQFCLTTTTTTYKKNPWIIIQNIGGIQLNSWDKGTLANKKQWGYFMKLWGTGSKNVISERFAKGYEAQTT